MEYIYNIKPLLLQELFPYLTFNDPERSTGLEIG